MHGRKGAIPKCGYAAVRLECFLVDGCVDISSPSSSAFNSARHAGGSDSQCLSSTSGSTPPFCSCSSSWAGCLPRCQIEFPAPALTGGWTLWSLTYDQWRDVQFATLCTFGFGILVHVMLHWNWVCSVITTQVLHTRERPDEGMQTIYGVATLIVLLHLIAAGVIVALVVIRRPPL